MGKWTQRGAGDEEEGGGVARKTGPDGKAMRIMVSHPGQIDKFPFS